MFAGHRKRKCIHRKHAHWQKMSMVEASYRWLRSGSVLQKGDGVLLGGSSLSQLEGNLTASASAEPLPPSVQRAMDGAFEITRDGAFPYWRSYRWVCIICFCLV